MSANIGEIVEELKPQVAGPEGASAMHPGRTR